MIQFNVQDISEYRGQLMGIATLLVIFGHSVEWCSNAKMDGISLWIVICRSRYIPPCKRLGAMVLAHKSEWK